jgi:23S rRNA pseudouridine1911/1915/1917 synthase
MTDRRWLVEPAHAGVRLDKYLAASDRLGSRRSAVAALRRGKVFVNDSEVGPAEAARRLVPGDRIRVWLDRPGSRRRRIYRPERSGVLAIVYEDDAIVVVNKPPGLLAVPLERQGEAPSVSDALAAHLRTRGKRRPLPVHRIDRDTSGLVVFATRPEAQATLKEQFRRHEPERVYLAVVHGHPTPASGVWRDRVVWDSRALIQRPADARNRRGRDAQSEYKVLEPLRGASLIEVKLHTGRRNQIRLQASLHGHGLLGEERYLQSPAPPTPIPFHRQALHAYRLAFRHPVTGRPVRFEAAVPADIEELLARLRKPSGTVSAPARV